MPTNMPKTLSCFGIVVFCTAGMVAATKPPANLTLQQCILEDAKKSGFSGVISVKRAEDTILSAHGMAGAKGSSKMSPTAQFNIGSAGKMWTAVSIAQLVDAGKMNLDDAIGRYIDGLEPEASAVTVRQLLTHSGGLGNFFVPENLDAMKRAKNLSDLKSLIIADKPAFKPGSRSEYSNTGFLLLGLAIEKASGMSYAQYLKKNIFSVAGMSGSSVIPASPKIRAIGMTNLPPPGEMPDGPLPGPPPGNMGPPSAKILPPPGPPPAGATGPMPPPMPMPAGPLRPSDEAVLMGTSAGGSFSTPADMQRFFAALFSGKLVSPEMLKALTSQQIQVLPAKGPLPAVYYGLGFMVGEYKGHRFTGHNGGAPGLNIATAVFPQDQVSAVIMSNRDPPAADMMMRRLQTMLFDESGCRG